MTYPSKLWPGNRVAVLSPSAGLPAIYPHVYETGLERLREFLGLIPVEYPTTRAEAADPRDRARDVCAAFADPSIAAVLATIGGDDQVTVVRHLDDDVLRANPKPFFGYSDNTHLLNHLFNLGLVGYHGGSVMVHLGRRGDLHPDSTDSLRAALFTEDWYDFAPAAEFYDDPNDWADRDYYASVPAMTPGTGWTWLGPTRQVEGTAWGGNLETISALLQVDRVLPAEAYAGCVLFVETSEELPAATEVYRILRNMGERGILAQFSGVMVGRPTTYDFVAPRTPEARRAYAKEQREAVIRAIEAYAPDAVLVLDVDFGHTDPQLIIPYGGQVRLDARARRISVRY
jgi:muramoyltetrapeptide carboxypeptidase LdcA involved in peptidoglycan recycling